MEKELTEKEAIQKLSLEMGQKSRIAIEKYKNVRCGRDGGETQELRTLNIEGGRRYGKLKEIFADHTTLPETEVMKIIKGDF